MMRYVFLAAGLVLVAVLVMRAGAGDVLAAMARVGWAFPLVIALYAAHIFVRAFALWQCLRANQIHLSYRDVVVIRFSSEAVETLTFTGPFLAEPAKAMLLKARGLALGDAVGGTLAEYLIYTFASAMVASAAILWLLAAFHLPGVFAKVAVVILVVMGAVFAGLAAILALRIRLVSPLVGLAARLPWIGHRITPDTAAGAARVDTVLIDLARDHPAATIRIIFTELAAHLLLMAEVAAVLVALGLWTSAVHPLLVEGGTKLASVVFFFVPGQVGASEGTFVVIFRLIGRRGADAGARAPHARTARRRPWGHGHVIGRRARNGAQPKAVTRRTHLTGTPLPQLPGTGPIGPTLAVVR